MKVLLDTHAFLWFILNNPRLSRRAMEIITDRANEVLLSPASYWEIAIKISAGKFRLDIPYEEFWRDGIEVNSIYILPIELRHTNQLLAMPFHHKDPFDRLLVAQSLADHVPLVSGDPALDAYGIQRLW
ncbi:MAG: type II toxin-antitoxin system VapC family toxin [Burkholderiales bacterium]|nr:type II toxin-antitoxin system VapC family toxin [Phycisphaerae bacterium]